MTADARRRRVAARAAPDAGTWWRVAAAFQQAPAALAGASDGIPKAQARGTSWCIYTCVAFLQGIPVATCDGCVDGVAAQAVGAVEAALAVVAREWARPLERWSPGDVFDADGACWPFSRRDLYVGGLVAKLCESAGIPRKLEWAPRVSSRAKRARV